MCLFISEQQGIIKTSMNHQPSAHTSGQNVLWCTFKALLRDCMSGKSGLQVSAEVDGEPHPYTSARM